MLWRSSSTHISYNTSIFSMWAQIRLPACKGLQALDSLLREVLPRSGLGLFLQAWNHIFSYATPEERHLPKQLTESSFQWFHLNFKKAQANSSPREAHSQNTKTSVCYHSTSPKVSCKYKSPRNSEIIVFKKIKTSFEKEIQGLQA